MSRRNPNPLPFPLPAVTPVIHVRDTAQAITNATRARECGADGVWLIDHGDAEDSLFAVAAAVSASVPGLWLGVNCLGSSMGDAVTRLGRSSARDAVGGYWSDDAGVVDDDVGLAQRDAEQRLASDWNGTYFGGVAFKYQKQPEDLALTVRRATQYCDVVCTSGVGTGQAADVAKLEDIRRAAGTFPIAVASGVTCDNVDQHLELIDVFLVATGISLDFHTLDPHLTERLIRSVHAAR